MVQILLLNSNLIILELFSLGLEGTKSNLIEISAKETLPQDFFDIVFIDESYGDNNAIQKAIDTLKSNRKIVLTTTTKSSLKGVTQIVTKPFLPKDIVSLLEVPQEIQKSPKKTSVLDLEEIQTIKELLDGEFMESRDRDISTNPKKKRQQDDFIEKLLSLKTKKIKKILEGAEITISIKFPKGEA